MWALFALLAIAAGFAAWWWVAADRGLPALAGAFAPLPLPSNKTQELMDMGVADVNGDDLIDIFTSNHNFRQNLWIADGHGGFADRLSDWGLDQYLDFPGMEISRVEPVLGPPGVYIFWKGRKTLAIRTHKLRSVGQFKATMRGATAVNASTGKDVSLVSRTVIANGADRMPDTLWTLAAEDDGELDLEIESPGVPLTVTLGGTLPLSAVFVGAHKTSPAAREFELRFQDRHGLAWADYNDDGLLDIFITRGAIGGTVMALPDGVQRIVKDELMVSLGPGRLGQFRDVAASVGISKRGCSGRKPQWVDFDRDGLLDLFINCEDRGNVKGQYSKQLYRQGADKRFVDVAEEVGLDLSDREVIDFVWFDFDGDGFPDLLTYEAEGFFLYRNRAGRTFARESIGRGKFVRADNPKLRGTADEYWFVDGKLAVADFDGNGSLDAFSSSKQGNTLLRNDGAGHFALVDPVTLGLPEKSASGTWVDVDNDGLLDLYAVPQGIFHQRRDHSFEPTGMLALPAQKYMAAIVSWPDFDNDGKRDVIMALDENFSFWNWYERLTRTREDRWTWRLLAYRNTLPPSHWLEVRLVGRPGNPQAIGANVTVITPEGRQLQAVGQNDGAFFSQGHYRLYFGLGPSVRADLEVRWPDGQVVNVSGVEADRLLVLRQASAPRREAAR